MALTQVSVEAKDLLVRRSAVEKLIDQALLAKIAVEDADLSVRLAAVEKLSDQAFLVEIALADVDLSVRRVAEKKLTYQGQLAKAALVAEDSKVGRVVLENLTNQALLAVVAVEARWLDIRLFAISKVSDQALLWRLAEQDPHAVIRQTVVQMITDDQFLVQRLSTETSAAVRAHIVATLHEKDSLRKGACTAYHQADRQQALQRMKDEGHDGVAEVALTHYALALKTKALAAETDKRKLLSLAIEGKFDVLRSAAARRLNDAAVLEQAALHATDREVLKILLTKLGDREVLSRIAADADDRAMRLAAAQQAGAKSWQQIFDVATDRGATVQMLGDALGAVSLFSEVQSDAKSGVQQACLSLIRRGDESRIPEMADLLEGYGDIRLAEDYLNCGQPDLDGEGREWARRRGLSVSKGSGSHRARWGSGR